MSEGNLIRRVKVICKSEMPHVIFMQQSQSSKSREHQPVGTTAKVRWPPKLMGIHPAGLLRSVKTITEMTVEIGERAARWKTAILEANTIQIYAADDEYSIWQDIRGHTDWTIIVESHFSTIRSGGWNQWHYCSRLQTKWDDETFFMTNLWPTGSETWILDLFTFRHWNLLF